jgi:uncharacterized protein YjdB
MKNVIVFLFFVFTFFACQKDNLVVTSISLPMEITLDAGSSKKKDVSHSPQNLPAPVYIWQSSDNSIFTVDNQGIVVGIKPGEGTLTVKSIEYNLTATSKVRVVPIQASSIVLSHKNVELLLGDSIQLNATVQPDNRTDKSITWTSGNNQVLTVTANGLVKAIGLGKANITVTAGTVSAQCEVVVEPIKVTGITLHTSTLSVVIGDEQQLVATVMPSNATNTRIEWKSTDQSIVSVSTEGEIAAMAVGTAEISARTEDGGFIATCIVEVLPIAVTGISLSMSSLSMEVGRVQTLSASIIPSNATNAGVEWISSDPTTVHVSAEGKVSGLKIGSAEIIVKTIDGGFTAKCIVEIVPAPVTGIFLNKNDLKLAVGENKTLYASIIPSNASNKSIKWSSDNPSVVSVDHNGMLSALSLGNAIISATTEDGGYSSTCNVSVLPIEYLVTIKAKGKNMQQSSTTGVNLILHSRLTNPTSLPITLLSVIFIDPGRNIIEIQPGGAMLVNDGSQYNSFNLHFDIYSVNDAFLQYLSKFKVIYQFRAQGKDYQVEQYFDARNWGSI